MSPSPGKHGYNQGFATLIVMIAVLTIIVLFCCCAAPGIRDLCKRYVFRSCVIDDTDEDNASTTRESSTPTIILLPYGRMLVVDRSVFSQLQADHSGIDFMELSASLIRARRHQMESNPSIFGSEATSKGLSPVSLGLSPPSYNDIFGEKTSDLPPSYSELSFLFKTYTMRTINEGEVTEMCTIAICNEEESDMEFKKENISDTNSVHIEIEEIENNEGTERVSSSINETRL